MTSEKTEPPEAFLQKLSWSDLNGKKLVKCVRLDDALEAVAMTRKEQNEKVLTPLIEGNQKAIKEAEERGRQEAIIKMVTEKTAETISGVAVNQGFKMQIKEAEERGYEKGQKEEREYILGTYICPKCGVEYLNHSDAKRHAKENKHWGDYKPIFEKTGDEVAQEIEARAQQETAKTILREIERMSADFKEQRGYPEREGYVLNHLKFLIETLFLKPTKEATK